MIISDYFIPLMTFGRINKIIILENSQININNINEVKVEPNVILSLKS